MTEWEIREQLCEVGRRTWRRGFVAANEGNFSHRLDDERVMTTPTLVSKGFMTPDDICTVDMEGNQIGGRRKATSEVRMHLHIYGQRPDVRSIVHAHPPHATAFAVVQEPIPKCVLPEIELSIGEIPILKYATPGTQNLAETFEPHLHDFNVFLMANHGAITLGADPIDALFKMELIEQYCHTLILTRQLGGPSRLTEQAMADLFEIKRRLGIPDRRLDDGGSTSCDMPSPSPKSPPIDESEIESIVREVTEALEQRLRRGTR